MRAQEISVSTVIRNALAFDFKNWRETNSENTMDSLLGNVADLFALLAQRKVDYVLVGGIALLQYVEGRNTEDIDLIVAVADLQKLPEIRINAQHDDFARGDFRGLRVDFLLTRNKLFDLVRRRHATTGRFRECEIPSASVEGLLLLKLYALPALYRMRNFARVGLYENDIATLMHGFQPDLAPLFEELARHLSDADLNAVRAVVRDLQARIARFENTPDN